jgi:hypothetical protein
VTKSRRAPATRPTNATLPKIAPMLKPLVEPVLIRLDRHEQLLEGVRAALDVQFQRTAAIQAQLDLLIAAAKVPR